jgi:MFS family permease
MLAWLWLAFFFNQADRQVYGVVLPQLKSELGLTDVESGMIASIFTATLAVSVPLAGYAGDLFQRKWLIAGSLFGWSLSTLFTGFATSLGQLIAIRSVATGAGEAVYAPSANALIGEHHVETRAQAMAIHQTALYAGVIASGFAAGWIADHFGWRASFAVFGLGGMLLAGLLAWRLRTGSAAKPASRPRPAEVLRLAVTRPTVPLLTLGFAAAVFVNVGYLTWMPTYLHERFGQSLASAGFTSMFYNHVFACAGVLLGGRISDRAARRNPCRRLQLQSAGLLLGAPMLYLAGAAGNEPLVYAALSALGFCRGFYEANIYAALFEVIEPRLHASTAGLTIAFAFLAGAASPVALGAVKQSSGLGVGISWMAAVFVAGGLSILAAARFFFSDDYRRVARG